ncbi:MAG: ATP-binding cassette domain-containing protein, partial [Eubacteriales bacterium]|nr:ATP-binding cassette domain-containing protein [Eubacteriales bacterium]
GVSVPCRPKLFPVLIDRPDLPSLEALLTAEPDVLEWRLLCESALLGVPEEALERPYATLSRGEQTKLQLAALFARDDAYPLIDEPTNHLDLLGRELVADYLSRKDGFLLVSHDRSFLNQCIDHTLSLNRSTVAVQRGNFDTWERELERRNQSEQSRNEQLKKDIKRLEESARKQAEWSRNAEKAKFHVAESDVASVDRGFVGARSAAMMKRSLSTQARRQRDIEEKSKLLKDVELVGELKLSPLVHPKKRLIEVRDAQVHYGERMVCSSIQFSLEQGERVALAGRNGAGKSSVLKTLCGLSSAMSGDFHVASGLVISYVPQDTGGMHGDLRSFIAESEADETLFKAILRNMDFGRQQFDKTIEQYSEGQKKKLLLARSLCEKAHVYIWDEPLNYIDVFSRMQLEALILQAQPTLLMVEHDRAFLERVCTRVVELK